MSVTRLHFARAITAALIAAPIHAAAAQRPVNAAPPAGAGVVVIFPDSLARTPRTVSELIREYAPAASVQRSSGALGASVRVSLRDALDVRGGEPLIVIDGIRQVRLRVSLDTLDRRPPSILDDIMVEDVERLEILAGPAAAASYGDDGEQGAIVVTTRAPGRGRPVLSASVTATGADAGTDYERNLSRTTVSGFPCPYYAEALGSCTATINTRYTPLLDRSPFRSAQQLRAHLGAAGGLGPLGYAATLGFGRGTGTLASNAADRTVASLRLRLPLASMVQLGLSSFATGRGVTFPAQGDKSVLAWGVGGGPLDCSPATPCGTDSTSGGYRFPLGWLQQDQPHRRIGHLGGAVTLDVDPAPSFSLRTIVTTDMFRDLQSMRDSSLPGSFPSLRQVTAEERSWRVGGAEEARVTGRFTGAVSTTLLAIRFDADRGRSASRSFNVALPTSPFAGSSSLSTTDAWLFRDRRSASLEQRLAWGDRATLGGGVIRTTTSFNGGRRPPALVDPHADAAYQLVRGGAPLGALQSLRLRTAWGRVSSQAFGALNAPYFGGDPFGGYPFWGNGSAPGPRPRMPASRSTELEGGIDAGFAPGASRLSVTTFRRNERLDYLATAGVGFPTDRKVTGGELLAEATPIDMPAARLHLRGQLAVSHDRVTGNLGNPVFLSAGPAIAVVTAGGESWGAWRMQDGAWRDSNGNGRIELGEVSGGGTVVRGRSRPSSLASVTSDLDVARSFTVSAVLDHVAGFDAYSAAAAQQCARRVCPALNDPNASIDAQGRAILAAGGIGSGFVVPGDATTLREVSVAWRSERAAPVLGANTLRVTLSGYDLAQWTKSKGLHPETDAPAVGAASGLWAIVQPIPRTFALRVALTY